MAVIIKISLGATTVTIASPAVFSYTAHGLVANDIIYLKTTGALPTGLTAGTAYYVISTGLTSNNFRVSTTLAGSAVNTSGSQSGVHTLFVDRATRVEYDSLNVQRAITSKIDTVEFDVVRKGGAPGAGYKPAQLNIVEILDGSHILFGGLITHIDSTVEAADVETFHCRAQDYSYDMNRHLIVATYEDMTIEDIIESIKDNFLEAGYTTTNVVCPIMTESISFNYESPTSALQQLATMVNHDWYVDSEKNIYFFAKATIQSPFDLTDTSGNYYYNTLELKDDLSNIRNSITVRGGEYLGLSRTESEVADGEKFVYKQGYRYSEISAEVNASPITVGIDNLNDPADFDALYNYQEKLLRFREDNKPAVDDIVSLTGLPHIPVLIKVIDPASILQYGEFEFKIVDKSISSRDEARTRARAELTGYAQIVNEGLFETMTAGLDVGQEINIQSTIRGISANYVISRITSTLHNGLQFKHRITLVTTRTYGMIEFLMALLTAQDKAIVINPDEIFGAIRNASDDMAMTDVLSTAVQTSPPYKWTSGTTTGVWNFATFG